MPNSIIHTYPGVEVNDIYAVQVDRSNVLFTDGKYGLFCYPGYGDDSYRVQDLVPFLTDTSGGAGVSVSECPYAPCGKYMMSYRGRLWFADDNNSIVYYSGTRQDYDRNDNSYYRWSAETILTENSVGDSEVEFTTAGSSVQSVSIHQTFEQMDAKITAVKYEVTEPLLDQLSNECFYKGYIEIGHATDNYIQWITEDDLSVGEHIFRFDEDFQITVSDVPYFQIVIWPDEFEANISFLSSNGDYTDGALTTPVGSGEAAGDDLTFAIYGKTFSLVDTPIQPWELWNVRLDLSRANTGHGGSMIVGNQNEKITGLCSTNLGVYVFKNNQILLWTWPDSAAPHEVTQGASIEQIASNIGLSSYRTIAENSNVIYFLAEDEGDKFSIYGLSGVETKKLTIDNSMKMNEIVDGSTAYASINGDYYMLFADTGFGVKPFIAINLVTGAFIELNGPVISCAATWDLYGKILLGTDDGSVYQYPGNADTDVSSDIMWRIDAQMTDVGKPFHENKFRKVWLGVDTLLGNIPTVRNEDITVELEFDDEILSYERSFSGRDMVTVNTSKRSNAITTRFFGSANGRIRVNNIGVAVRERRERQ